MNDTFHDLTLLVVEDDWILREDLVNGLRDEGATVLEVATGGGALATLRGGEQVDLLVTDIQLADAVTGWDVAEAFRASNAQIPVIYVSGNPANDIRLVAGSIFLSKPIAIWQLVGACSDLLAPDRSP
jgi:CheY-like chemotaxis protein